MIRKTFFTPRKICAIISDAMLKRFSLVLLLILVVSMNVSGSVSSYILPLSSSIYDDMDALYRLTGQVPPSTSRPWSAAEARLILSRLDEESMTPDERRIYIEIEKIIDDAEPRWRTEDSSFGFGTELKVQPEIYAHSNGSDFRGEEDWAYTYDERAPFLHLGIDMSVFDTFYTYADLQYTMGRYDGDGIEKLDMTSFPGIGAIVPPGEKVDIVTGSKQYYSTFSSNIPPHSSRFEFEWPKRALISIGGSFWNFMLGRDRISWGNSEIGNFVIDGHVGYQDMMRLEFFTDKFKYEWTNLFFETKYYPTEAAGTEEDSIRMLMAHRLEFRPLSWLSFAISENVMYHAKTLNLKYLNPAFIFHNLNDRTMFNAIAYGEISILPFAGWEIYGQFVLDQARAPNESDRQSDAWGVLAGTRSTHSLWGGYIEPSLEFAYTTPLLYRRDGLDFLMYQRSFTYDGGSPIKLYYIGFPYGGDVMMLHFALDWVLPGKAEASLSFDGILKGEMNMLKSHNKDGDNSGDANYSGITPSGNEMMRIFILSLYGKYSFPELWNFANVSIWSELSFVGSDIYKKDSGTASDGRFDVQFVLGFSIGI